MFFWYSFVSNYIPLNFGTVHQYCLRKSKLNKFLNFKRFLLYLSVFKIHLSVVTKAPCIAVISLSGSTFRIRIFSVIKNISKSTYKRFFM